MSSVWNSQLLAREATSRAQAAGMGCDGARALPTTCGLIPRSHLEALEAAPRRGLAPVMLYKAVPVTHGLAPLLISQLPASALAAAVVAAATPVAAAAPALSQSSRQQKTLRL